MKKQKLLFGVLFLFACAPQNITSPSSSQSIVEPSAALVLPSETPLPTQTEIPTSTPAPPTNTLIPPTPTLNYIATVDSQVLSINGTLEVLNSQNSDLVQENATLQAEINSLQSQLAAAQTQQASSSSSSSSSSSVYPNTRWPEGVADVVFLERSLVWEVKGYNNLDRPIMEIYEPRVKFQMGDILQVYTKRIAADGGGTYYEVFDPDGAVTIVLFVRSQDIHVIDPDSSDPYNVVTATSVDKAYLWEIVSTNDKGIPLMQVHIPRYVFTSGEYVKVILEGVKADGGGLFIKVYDPNHKYPKVLYLQLTDLQLNN